MEIKNKEENDGDEYENAVALTGFGKFNIALVLIIGLSIFSGLVDSVALAFVLPAAQCDLNLTLEDKTTLSSIGFAGIVSSCLFWGFLGDVLGRKKIIIFALYASFIFGAISSMMTYVWLFITLRFFNGFFAGCPISVAFAYVGEFHSNNYRAKIISWVGGLVAISLVYLPALSWIILPMDFSYLIPGLEVLLRPWRVLLILSSFPSFISATFLLFFPESPKFLWSIGKTEESMAVVKQMYAANTGNSKDSFPVAKFVENFEMSKEKDVNSSKSISKIFIDLIKLLWKQIGPLFQMPMLPNTVLASVINFGIQATSHGFFMWFPIVINQMSLFMSQNPEDSVTICKAVHFNAYANMTEVTNVTNNETIATCKDVVDENVFIITLIVSTMHSILLISLGFIINIVGKKMLMVIFFMLGIISACIIPNLYTYISIMLVTGVYLLLAPFTITVNTVVVDLYSTQYRAMAVAITSMFGRLGAVVGSYVTGYLLQYYCGILFYTYAFNYIVLIGASLLLPLPLFPKRNKV